MSSRGRTEPEKLSSCSPEPTTIKQRHEAHQEKTETCWLVSGLTSGLINHPGVTLKHVVFICSVLDWSFRERMCFDLITSIAHIFNLNVSRLLFILHFLTFSVFIVAR